MTSSTELAPLSSAFPRIAALIGGGPEPEPPPPTVADRLAERFGLDSFARDVLVLTAWSELEPEAAIAISQQHGDPDATQPTIGLALATFPDAHWSALSAEGPLRASGLLSVGPGGHFVARPLSLPESVLLHMVGVSTLSEELARVSRRHIGEVALTPVRRRLRDEIVASLGTASAGLLQLCGNDAVGKECAAAAAARALDLDLFVMPAAAIPTNQGEIAALAGEWMRDLALLGGVLLVDGDLGGEPRFTAAFAEAMAGPLLIGASDSIHVAGRSSVRLEMSVPTLLESQGAWREALGPLAERLNGSVTRLAAHFSGAPELMETVASELAGLPDDADIDGFVWSICRRRSRPAMDDLAERLITRATWDDLVLPDTQMKVLRTLAAQIRNRAQVHGEWGFEDAADGRGLGVTALFSGPPGTGKTLAAGVLGSALDLDVYRIDLSAIVSKWIGETEKNLRRVFDAAEEGSAILLFDEADALFGKRSEVNDSHDRYANVEVSYLLQRLESYRGMAILTTNLRANIDEAFVRRLRFVVEFSFPGPDERVKIWERAFPDDCPTEINNLQRLGQLNVVGAEIRNIAVNAAFMAADRGKLTGVAEVLESARLEYAKAARGMTSSELKGLSE